MTAPTPEAAERLRALLARIALAAAALTLVVIVASAFMRHTQAGLSCDNWPACYGKLEAPDADAVPGSAVRLARIAHRLAATGVLALIVVMLLIAWTQKPAWKREGRFALAALGIAAALAVLGIATPGARLPAITLGNLLGGFTMLAVLAATRAAATPSRSPSDAARTLAKIAIAVAFGQAAIGGLIGAQYASLACPALGDCGAWSWNEFLATGAWNPLRPPAMADGRVVAPSGAAGLHVLHRSVGIAVVALALLTAAALRRAHPGLASALALLIGAAALLGVGAVSAQPPLAVAVVHNACAALLFALLAAVATMRAH